MFTYLSPWRKNNPYTHKVYLRSSVSLGGRGDDDRRSPVPVLGFVVRDPVLERHSVQDARDKQHTKHGPGNGDADAERARDRPPIDAAVRVGGQTEGGGGGARRRGDQHQDPRHGVDPELSRVDATGGGLSSERDAPEDGGRQGQQKVEHAHHDGNDDVPRRAEIRLDDKFSPIVPHDRHVICTDVTEEANHEQAEDAAQDVQALRGRTVCR